jgi:hypothetical protein
MRYAIALAAIIGGLFVADLWKKNFPQSRKSRKGRKT